MNKTILITGATNGIGKATAIELAKKGATVLIHGRNRAKGGTVLEEIKQKAPNTKAELFIADFASQSEIRKMAKLIQEKHPVIDVLINNAGFLGYPERQETEEGIEAVFAINHLAPFLLTNLLMENVKASIKGRIVTISSIAQKMGKIEFDNLQFEKEYGAFMAYANTKLMNILFNQELAKRLSKTKVTSNCLHPGTVSTGIARTYGSFFNFLFGIGRPFFLSPEKGAQPSIYLATSPQVEGVSGAYFKRMKKIDPTLKMKNVEEVQYKLWEESSRLANIPNVAYF